MLYMIERDFTGYTEEQINAAAFRALLCISFFDGMRWLRSFYDPVSQQSRCFYEAPSAGDVRHHGFSMAIPVGDVRPVVEIRREGSDGIAVGEPNDASDSRDPSGLIPPWVARLETNRLGQVDLAEKFAKVARRPDGRWVRAYIDHELREVFAVYQAVEESDVIEEIRQIDLTVRNVFRVSEVLPSDVREMPPMGSK